MLKTHLLFRVLVAKQVEAKYTYVQQVQKPFSYRCYKMCRHTMEQKVVVGVEDLSMELQKE